MTKPQPMPCWGMSPCPTTRAVVCRSLMQRAVARVCVLALALGLVVQGVAAEGLRQEGKDLIAEDIFAVLAGFGILAGYNEEPEPTHWMVMGAEGRHEKSLKSAEGLMAYFHTLPKERRARGIFITGEITHLEDPAASEPPLSAHVKKLLADPNWVAARTQGIERLTEVCEREKIDLWVNVTWGGRNQRFRKLTK